jgi:hypothetical protein
MRIAATRSGTTASRGSRRKEVRPLAAHRCSYAAVDEAVDKGGLHMPKWLLLVAVLTVLAVGGVANFAYASSNKEVTGSGTGAVTCTAGGPALPAAIQFTADLNKGSISGFFVISGTSVFKFGGVISGSVSTNSYHISGNETFAMCVGAAFPTTYTIGRPADQA